MGFTDTSIGRSITSVCAIFLTTLSKQHGLCNSLSSFLDKTFSVLLNHWLFDNLHQSDVTFKRRVRARSLFCTNTSCETYSISHWYILELHSNLFDLVDVASMSHITTTIDDRGRYRATTSDLAMFSLTTEPPTATRRYHHTS
jgi:hypothetical protein